MSGDPVYALPEPDVLWVFNMMGLRMSGASPTVIDDGEGEWHRESGNAASVPFMGYVTAANPREADRAKARGWNLDAVALAPLVTTLTQGDWLDCTLDPTIPPPLRHTFVIKLDRPNLSHLRLLLTRSDTPAPYPD